MKTELKPKIADTRWTPSRELDLLKKWAEEGLDDFKYLTRDQREIIVIDTPPPYASGKWHVGGAAHYAQIDMIARYFRMKGYAVIVPFYADRNGLPVEVQVEKTYRINAQEIARTPEGRQRFLELCRKFLDETEQSLVSIWKRLGCSFEYWINGTDSVEYRTITQATFIELYRKGLIYEAERPVNWCPRCKTTLADAELEYIEEDAYLYYIKFPLKDSNEYLIVATTRPELLKSCKALAFNPRDHRFQHLEGKSALNPLYGHEMPIYTHDSADPDFGTGIIMVCSYGDKSDVVMFRDLRLEPLVIINKDGILTEEAGILAGLDIKKAREKVAQLLEEKGLLAKKERIKHNVPVCWRCKTPIQIINAKEWFLKQLDFKEDLLKIIEEIEFKPEFHKIKLVEWIKSVSTDWPISRDRYYATEVPIWRCKRCNSVLVPEPGKYYRPWLEPAPWDKCPNCGANREELEGERKVFDTWFDSSISVLYASSYMRNNELFRRAFKNTLRPQGVDIIRTWLYYTLLRVYQLTGKPAFRWVRISGMGLDEKGEAMHKSKGNVIDPEPFIEKYGADAFRFWAAISAKLGYDYRFSESTIKTGLLFATKLWNIARYISSFPVPETYELRPVDKSTLALLDRVIANVDSGYRDLDVYVPINEIYQFTWNYFAAHYIELTKSRAYNYSNKYNKLEQQGAWYTLHYVLQRVLEMLAPIMPFVTDAIYRELYGKSVHVQEFPKPLDKYGDEYVDIAMKIQDINHALWRYKKAIGIKLSDPIEKTVYLPVTASQALDELVDLHRLKHVEVYADKEPANSTHIGGGVYIAL